MVGNIQLANNWQLLARLSGERDVLFPLQLQSEKLLVQLQSGASVSLPLGNLHQIAFLPGVGFTFMGRMQIFEGNQIVQLNTAFQYRLAFFPYRRCPPFVISVFKPVEIEL